MANLLQKASIVLTPTAYNNNRVMCVKPSDGNGDLTFSRNSAATRVNAQGLVENVQILSSNLVQNGDFSEEGAEEVSNGSFSQEGAEQITNGSFATDSDWNLGSGINISGGSVNFTGVPNANINQNAGLVTGKTYKIVFTVSNYVSGDIDYNVGGNTRQGAISANGTYTDYVVSDSGQLFYFQSDQTLGFTGSIDNCSIREVGQDWLFSGGAEITEQGVRINNTITGANAYIKQSNSNFTIGKSFVLEYDVVATNGTNLAIEQTSSIALNTSTVGNNRKIYFQWDIASTGFVIKRQVAGTDVTITNISVKEVGQDWTLDTGWSIGDNKMTGNSAAGDSYQDLILSGGEKTFKITFDCIVNSGQFAVRFINKQWVSASGTYTIYETTTSSRLFVDGRASQLFSGSVTNISVIEITTDTNLPRINYENGCGSFLFEPQSTNLVITSDTGVYGSSPASEILEISPDGTINAVRPVPSTGSNRYQQTLAAGVYSSGQKLTYSWYRKRISTPVEDTYVGDLYLNILVNITVFEATTQIQSNINGYDRFQVVIQITDGSLSSIFRAYFGAIIGTGNSSVAYWGHQYEIGDYATSIIPTEGSTVTRNQDLCTNGGSLATINSTEGTLYFEGSTLVNGGSTRIISLSDGTNNNLIYIRFNAETSRFFGFARGGGGSYTTVLKNGINQTDNNKVALVWDATNFKIWINGSQQATATINSLPIEMNTLNFTSPTGSDVFFGKTKCVAVWKEALSDAELTALTTI